MEQLSSVESTQHLTRQSSLIPMEKLKVPIVVIGAGAIGSFVTLSLAKMGFEDIEVWDADTVSIENMNSQFYRFSDIDQAKTKALQSLVKDFTKVKIRVKTRFYETGILDGIVICAVDSMEARKTIWDNHMGKSTSTVAIIDPRMGAEEAQMHVVSPMDPTDMKSYPKTLYTDDQAVQEACTAKATIYTATMLAGLVCKAVKDIAVDGKPSFRTAQWSIKHNDLVFFARKTRKEDAKSSQVVEDATEGVSPPNTSTTLSIQQIESLIDPSQGMSTGFDSGLAPREAYSQASVGSTMAPSIRDYAETFKRYYGDLDPEMEARERSRRAELEAEQLRAMQRVYNENAEEILSRKIRGQF